MCLAGSYLSHDGKGDRECTEVGRHDGEAVHLRVPEQRQVDR
jgi:hypothetical protein